MTNTCKQLFVFFQYVITSKLFFTDFLNIYAVGPEITRFVSPSLSKWNINAKEIECNRVMEPSDRVAMASHNKELTCFTFTS